MEQLVDTSLPLRLVPYPNVLLVIVCFAQVTAGKGDSEEKRIFLFSLRRIAMGEEIVYSYPAPGSLGLGTTLLDECACGAPMCCGIMDNCDDILERMNSIDWHTTL
ncbi:unnamed protein product [Ectocarpus sp. CCAP 1310/34]|nr:unnamed protein product [Ectocarpus sp. CCAP 1310/34]